MMFESNQKDWDDFYLADTARGYQVGDIFGNYLLNSLGD
jgi:hypothetical protein